MKNLVKESVYFQARWAGLSSPLLDIIRKKT